MGRKSCDVDLGLVFELFFNFLGLVLNPGPVGFRVGREMGLLPDLEPIKPGGRCSKRLSKSGSILVVEKGLVNQVLLAGVGGVGCDHAHESEIIRVLGLAKDAGCLDAVLILG